MFNMAASRHLGFGRNWNRTTAKVAADLYVLVCHTWLRFVNCGRVTTIYVFKMAAGCRLWFSQKWNLMAFLFLGCSFLSLNQISCEYVQLRLSYGQKSKYLKWRPPPSWILSKWNLTSGEVAAEPYLSPCQIWWRYLKGRSSYGDLCIFKMAVGRHLGFFLQKWTLKVFLFPGRQFFSLSQILCKYVQ